MHKESATFPAVVGVRLLARVHAPFAEARVRFTTGQAIERIYAGWLDAYHTITFHELTRTKFRVGGCTSAELLIVADESNSQQEIDVYTEPAIPPSNPGSKVHFCWGFDVPSNCTDVPPGTPSTTWQYPHGVVDEIERPVRGHRRMRITGTSGSGMFDLIPNENIRDYITLAFEPGAGFIRIGDFRSRTLNVAEISNMTFELKLDEAVNTDMHQLTIVTDDVGLHIEVEGATRSWDIYPFETKFIRYYPSGREDGMVSVIDEPPQQKQ